MTEYVAVTDVTHGESDGKRTTFAQGKTVTDLPQDVMQELYAAGSITPKGSPDDPNLLEYDNGPGLTTPAMVQEALRVQAAALEGPGGADTDLYQNANTQPGREDHPENPADLLQPVNVSGSADEAAKVEDEDTTVTLSSTTPGGGATTTGSAGTVSPTGTSPVGS
jgi:hypothetical protein